MNEDPQKSAQPCGCDEGANYWCAQHEAERNARDEGYMDGAYNEYSCTMEEIRKLREEWDHIEQAVQVLDALWERLSELHK